MQDPSPRDTGKRPAVRGMSLRLRLVLAFMTVVSLLLLVGMTSFYINRQVQDQVADLRSGHGVDLHHVDIHRVGLQIEGFWDPRGSFVATGAEVLPRMRRPKLRGAIQSVDASQRTITLYGVPIRVRGKTKFVDSGSEAIRFEDLKAGQRIEVSCSVVNDRWTARKIKTRDVKPSDKIKGTVTAAELDGQAPETLELHGLRVSLAQPKHDAPKSALRRIALATQMTLALQECRVAAYALVGRTLVSRDLETTEELERDIQAPTTAIERLVRGERNFEYYLEQSLKEDEIVSGSSLPEGFAPWLRPLTEERSNFRDQVEKLERLARENPQRAREFLNRVFAPFLQNDLVPLVYAYRSEAEDALTDQVQAIASRTDVTTRVALATSAFAVILAIILGVRVSKSIRDPIRALNAAALRLGHGHLDTRVEIHSRDELGALAETFNKMAQELATTTVSVSNLKSIEARLVRSLSEKEVLLREVHHRVKNNMQVISSLLAIQSSQVTDGPSVQKFEESQNRIQTIALIHEQLYKSSDLGEIDLRGYLERLTSHLLESFALSDSIRLRLQIEDLSVGIDRAVTCGLIVNELVTNALKHAFSEKLSGQKPPGEIEVSLFAADEGYFVLSVADNGCGIHNLVDLEHSQSLGLSLVKTLVKQLGGQLAINGEKGTEARVIFPQEAPARAESS